MNQRLEPGDPILEDVLNKRAPGTSVDLGQVMMTWLEDGFMKLAWKNGMIQIWKRVDFLPVEPEEHTEV